MKPLAADRITALHNWVKANFSDEDPSHDFAHVMRVHAWAVRLGRELNADLSLLEPAAYLHDVVSVPKNHPDRARAAEMAAEKARSVLVDFGWDETSIRAITLAISEHSFSAGKAPTSLESAILQDADRLDAIGSIGIARVFACGTRMGAAFYDPVDPFSENRPLDDKKFSLDHFYVKLLKLPERMNTDPARREAQRRLETMERFLAQLEREMFAGTFTRI